MGKLTGKQEKFCLEYLKDLNATQAAIRAGYSEKTATVIGAQNLTKVNIQEFINEAREKDANNAEIDRAMVLEAYRRLAFYDARKFYDADGNILSVPDLDEETAFALTGFDVMEEKGGTGKGTQEVLGYTKKIKMSNRKDALDSICKVLGFNSADKVEHSGKITNINSVPLTPKEIEEISKKFNDSY